MANATYEVKWYRGSFLEFTAFALRQVRLLLYSSERSNTRATHIQCCPREPQAPAADHQGSLANRVRSATAFGSVGSTFTWKLAKIKRAVLARAAESLTLTLPDRDGERFTGSWRRGERDE